MEPLRLYVKSCEQGFVAESLVPSVMALGTSPQEAAENARLKALALCADGSRTATLLVRWNDCGRNAILTLPFDEPVSLV